jgi:hypothetical protein
MKVEIICQSKGGVGKSFYTYFRALSVPDENSLFIDVDSSTRTSSRQLKLLGPDRLEGLSLLNNKEVIVRDTFIGYLEGISKTTFRVLYFDFGAAESQQLPALFRDIPMLELCIELGLEVKFNVIIGGGGAYKASIDYLQEILSIANGDFEIMVWANINSFSQFPSLLKELENNCKKLGLQFKSYGDFESSTLLAGQILDGVRKGYSLDDYSPGARIRIKKELKENFSHE